MPDNARTKRGRDTEFLIAEWFRDHGWPDAKAVPKSLPGRDVTGMPGYAPESKARNRFNPLAWMRQAVRNAEGDMPFVVMRCNGQGEESMEEWFVISRLGDFTRLIEQDRDGR